MAVAFGLQTGQLLSIQSIPYFSLLSPLADVNLKESFPDTFNACKPIGQLPQTQLKEPAFFAAYGLCSIATGQD